MLLSKRRVLLALQVFLIVLLLVPIGWQLYCLYVYHQASTIPAPPHFGNSPANIREASAGGQNEEVRFVVAGDSRGFGTFELLMDQINVLKPQFIVLVGDISRRATEGDHLFLQLEMATEMVTKCPVFYAVGNHDVGPRYPRSTWEQTYGPSQFSFMRQGNLFIICDIPKEPDEAAKGMQFLEDELRAKSAGAKRIFVFNHVPPDLGMSWKGEPLPQQERFMALLEQYEVDYLICGDYHSYAAIDMGKTRLIITGGGGADLRGGMFSFHHAVLITAREDTVEERICAVPSILAPGDRMESEALASVVPFIRQHKLLVGAANILILLGIVILAVRVARAVRR